LEDLFGDLSNHIKPQSPLDKLPQILEQLSDGDEDCKSDLDKLERQLLLMNEEEAIDFCKADSPSQGDMNAMLDALSDDDFI
jgi:hypothetical protein